ncbi:MAG: NADH-quinone oxidoreductase subunit N [Actinomycetota bacterium]|nr:NADH-quinone oxidoreductase subunit N [Actinomycetota bacterium]
MTTPVVNWIAILPELALALGAAAVLLIEVQWKPLAGTLGTAAASTLVFAGAFGVVQWIEAGDALSVGATGDLVAFSGMIVMDGFSIFGRFALLAITAIGLMAAWKHIEGLGRRGAEAIALVLLATAGFSIMVAANNLVMMFLGLEVGSIALYVLAGLTRERSNSDEAALKYFLLGSFASALFVYGVALLYAGTGQFEILGMRAFFTSFIVTSPAVILIGIGLVIVGLGFKVSAAPFHSWAPDVYQGAPAGIVGYMAAVAKIAGFAALARILLTAVPDFSESWLPVVAGISVLSMLGGSVMALVQTDVRRMLAYTGVATAGFIMTGVVGGATTPILFYVAVYAFQLVGAFSVVSTVSGAGTSSSSFDEYRGLADRNPGLAAAFSVLLLGMAGLPLTSGFVAKFGVFANAWAVGYEWLVIVAVLASVVTFAVYLRVIITMYMDESDVEGVEVAGTAKLAMLIAVAATVVWGILPGSLLEMAADALPL